MTAAVKPRPAARAAETPILSVTLSRETLSAGLQRAMLAAATKTTLPILSAAKITHGPDGLTFVTTDLDRTLTTTIPTPDAPTALLSAGPEPVTLPVKRLLDIVTQLPPNPVTLEVFAQGAGYKAKVSAGRSKFEILGLPASEFPLPEPLTPEIRTTLDAPAFLAALARALPQTSMEPSKPVQHGILVEATENGLYLAATDSYHLSQERLLDATELRGEWNVPRTAVPAILKLFGDAEVIDIAVGDTRMAFAGKNATLEVRLVGGQYPQYRHLLALVPKFDGVVDRTMLVAAVKRMRALSEVQRVTLTWREKELVVTAEHADGNRGEDSIACTLTARGDQEIPDEGVVTAYNPTYLLDILSAQLGDEVVFQITGNRSDIAYVRDAEHRDGPIATVVVGLRVPTGL
jgi:DNA polymerase-3 subunit beta